MKILGVARLILFVPLLIVLLSGPRGLAGAAAQMPRPVPPADAPSALLATQILLDRAGFSPGELDGAAGANTRRALNAFRRARGLSRASDAELRRALDDPEIPLLVDYVITPDDAAGPFVAEIPADPMAQAALPVLAYTSVLELVAERTHSSPELLRQLNPAASFAAGETLRVPNVVRPVAATTAPDARPAASLVVVSRDLSGLTAYDARRHVIFFAPVTSGSEHDPLPLGRWTVTAVVRNPRFNYNPALFWDADATQAKARLPPGPNGPVGTVWIDLSKPHYGIHGTAEPGQIGHTTSHGCVRLTNWDAETLAGLVRKGTAVSFVR